MASIVLDDTYSRLTTSGDREGTWSRIAGQQFFNGSATYPPFAADTVGDTGNYGILTIIFQGTSITLFGNTPDLFYSQNILVSIDGAKPYNTNYSDSSAPSVIQWYQSPLLSDGQHTIQISHIAGTSVDMAVVTAGQTTPLSGQRLIVDDGDPAIAYSDNWSRNTARFNSLDTPKTGLPYGNATHQTTTPGSSMTFVFAGTEVGVYGLVDFSHVGTLVVVYTIDSIPVAKTYAVTADSPDHARGVKQRPNALMYISDELPAGNHVLKIELMNNTNQAVFALDYLLYKPSFGTLATKPSLDPSSTSSLPAGSGSSTVHSHVPTSSGLIPADVSGGQKSHSSPVGAIVGGVIGGVVALILLALLVLYRKREQKRKAAAAPVPSTQQSFLQRAPVEPFIAMSPVQSLPEHHKYTNSMYPNSTMSSLPHPNVAWGGSEISGISTTDSQGRSPKSLLALSNPGPITPLAPVRRDNRRSSTDDMVSVASNGNGPAIRTRMQRLQDIMREINHEIEVGNEGSVRVAVLRGRMAELTRVDVQEGGQGPERALTPPPYEPRRF